MGKKGDNLRDSISTHRFYKTITTKKEKYDTKLKNKYKNDHHQILLFDACALDSRCFPPNLFKLHQQFVHSLSRFLILQVFELFHSHFANNSIKQILINILPMIRIRNAIRHQLII